MFHLNTTLNFENPPLLVFQLEVYFKVGRLLTGQLLNKKEQLLDGIEIKHLYLSVYIYIEQKILFYNFKPNLVQDIDQETNLLHCSQLVLANDLMTYGEWTVDNDTILHFLKLIEINKLVIKNVRMHILVCERS